jgi:hypothetical protein
MRLRNESGEENVIAGKRKKHFIFRQYKGSGEKGEQVEDIPTTLATILKRWTVLNPHDWLLMNVGRSGPIQPPQLTLLLNGFFGKNVSTTMLRHSYLSHVYKDVPTVREVESRAKTMAHTPQMAMKYVKK